MLDFGNNVIRHGAIDQIEISERDPKKRAEQENVMAKKCPSCSALINTAYANCPECGYAFPKDEADKHEATASTESILSDPPKVNDYMVTGVDYMVHEKRGDPLAPKTLRVSYNFEGLLNFSVSEWVCFSHSGYARGKAELWWQARSDEPCPPNTHKAWELAVVGKVLAEPTELRVRKKHGDYDRIIGYKMGAKPICEPGVREEAIEHDTHGEEEVPF